MASPSLSGPHVPPLTGPATHLVVLVHGYGSDGADLIALAPHWQRLLPTAVFSAPNAPHRLPGSPGYQWFPIARIDPAEMRRGVEGAGPALDAFLDEELARLGVPPERLLLVGFSQGTMLSLQVGLHRAVPPAAIVGFSGLLAAPPPPLSPDKKGSPIFLSHGDADPVVPVQAMLAAVSELDAAGYAVQWHLARGVGHGIDPETLALAGDFLGRAFSGAPASSGPASQPPGRTP